MQFQSYRVVHRMHLGGLDRVLEVGCVVQFNGSTLKAEDGVEIKLSEPSAIAGAIKIGWLVPSASKETTFTPKSAGVLVHSAKSTGEKRMEVNVMTVHDEEQNVGNRKAVRQNSASENSARASSGDEGVVVSRIKTPAKAPPVEMGSEDQAALRNLERQTLSVEKVRSNKVGVAEAASGDELEDILPEASSARPPKRVYANDGVVASSGGASSIGGPEDGVVISKVGVRPQASPRFVQQEQEDDEETLLPEDLTFREKALRRWALTGKTWNGQPVSLRDLSLLALSVLDSLDGLRAQSPGKTSPQAAVSVRKTVSAAVVGEIEWDLNSHWKTRKASLQQYLGDSDALTKIYALESSGGVKKAIEAMLQDMGVPLP
jgi:hypothetical protein